MLAPRERDITVGYEMRKTQSPLGQCPAKYGLTTLPLLFWVVISN